MIDTSRRQFFKLMGSAVAVAAVTPAVGTSVAQAVGSFVADDAGGWMLCDGRILDGDQFPDLFAAIGRTYGGLGSMFQLPDLLERYEARPEDPRYAQGPMVAVKVIPFNHMIKVRPGEDSMLPVGAIMPFVGKAVA